MFPWMILGICILGIALLGLINWWQNRGPTLTGRATIVSRRVAPGRGTYVKFSGSGTWNYYVTFRLSDGEEIELCVFEQQFPQLKEGLTGQLTWCRDDLYDFVEE